VPSRVVLIPEGRVLAFKVIDCVSIGDCLVYQRNLVNNNVRDYPIAAVTLRAEEM
jgi:hypothetical protein